jgi:lysozyme
VRSLASGLLVLGACAGEITNDGGGSEQTEAASYCPAATADGIDVSDAQGAIDWSRVAASGAVAFAVIKATQGTYDTQRRFAANWAGARDAGIPRAAYHFFDPTEDGAAQAQKFIDALAGDPGELAPVVDAECPNGDPRCLGWSGGAGTAPSSLIRQRLVDCLQTIQQATGMTPMLYTANAYFTQNGIDPTGLDAYPLWIAYPTASSCLRYPPPWSTPAIWQWSWTGRVSGINGNVDRDRMLVPLTARSAPVPSPVQQGCEGFTCADGSCIDASWVCDGWPDCPNGDDEAGCPTPTPTPTSCSGFTCADGSCIDASWVCDGWADCPAGDDETSCDAPAPSTCDGYTCSDGSCIDASWVCDGWDDCPDGGDETGCW